MYKCINELIVMYWCTLIWSHVNKIVIFVQYMTLMFGGRIKLKFIIYEYTNLQVFWYKLYNKLLVEYKYN